MLPRSASTPHARRFAILSPADGGAIPAFASIVGDPEEYNSRLAEMQRFRGDIYLREGAISSAELTSDGRHVTPEDAKAWHLLVINEQNRVVGCMRYLAHWKAVRLAMLGASSSPLALSDEWGPTLKAALRADIEEAHREGVAYSEIGGWALADELRTSTEGIRIVLATYGLAQLLGDGIGVSTATMRNGSAKILRRLGGTSVSSDGLELPPYFDPHYNCEMELLKFDSRKPNPRYAEWVDHLHMELHSSRVICPTPGKGTRKMFPYGATANWERRV